MSLGADTYLVGAAKAGTTRLYGLLREHPEVWAPKRKEPGYYARWPDDRRPLEEDGYAALYAPGRSWAKILLDGSVRYFYDPDAVPRVLADVPEARFVVSLRSPIRTVASLHDYLVNEGYQSEPDLVSCPLEVLGY